MEVPQSVMSFVQRRVEAATGRREIYEGRLSVDQMHGLSVTPAQVLIRGALCTLEAIAQGTEEFLTSDEKLDDLFSRRK